MHERRAPAGAAGAHGRRAPATSTQWCWATSTSTTPAGSPTSSAPRSIATPTNGPRRAPTATAPTSPAISKASTAGAATATSATLCAGLRIDRQPGHTAGHRSLVIELPDGAPVILAGDAADLQENLDAEIAPGILWRDGDGRVREDLALASIRAPEGAGPGPGRRALAQPRPRPLAPAARRGWPIVVGLTVTGLRRAPARMPG